MSDSSNITGRPWGNVASYTDAEWHEMYASLFDGSAEQGVVRDPDTDLFAVTETDPVGMSVQVGTGTGIVGGLWGQNESAVTLTVAANGGGANRYDLVFLHWDRTNQDLRVRIVDGTAATCALAVAPASNAIATYQTAGPPVTQWAVPLACITVVPAAVQILNADITDLREYCRFRTAAGDIADGTSVTTQVVAGLVPAMTDTGAVLALAANGVGITEISTALAGDALTGGGGAALDVVPGTGLELAGDVLQIAAAAAGDGLSGGAGAALDVNVDTTTIVIAADTLSIGTVNNGHITNRTGARQFISASEMNPSVGSAVTWGTLGGLPVPSEGWLFPNGSNNYVGFHAKVPIGYLATSPFPPPLTFVWAHVNAGATLTCLWRMYYASTPGGPPWTYNCGDLLDTQRQGSVTANVAAADQFLRLCTPTVEYLYYLETGEAYMDFAVGRVGASDTYGASVLLLGVYVQSNRDM